MTAKRKIHPPNATPRQAAEILDILSQTHPDARIYLDFDGPFQLLIATILSAQCTDERVNSITPELFERYPGPADFVAADAAEIEELVRPTGFFRQKTAGIVECCRCLVEEHGGEVPDDLDALTAMKGVGRKTANVVLLGAFGRQTIPVDTHVKRVSTRLGLTAGAATDKIEAQLCDLIPERRRARAALVLGTHGRRVCTARLADCGNCPINRLCAFYRGAGGGANG